MWGSEQEHVGFWTRACGVLNKSMWGSEQESILEPIVI